MVEEVAYFFRLMILNFYNNPSALDYDVLAQVVLGKKYKMQKITILGATGSIGKSTLDVLTQNPDRYQLYGVACAQNSCQMFSLICKYGPQKVALADQKATQDLIAKIKDLLSSASAKATLDPQAIANLQKVEVIEDIDPVLTLASDPQAPIVVGAIVGAAGLLPLLAAVRRGATICLANKESLVMSGKLFFDEAKKYQSKILPVDSEHSAIFQCLPEVLQNNLGYCALKDYGINKILLTGSGGPFRQLPLTEFDKIKPQDAINHPVWSMGPKISVDSATMMNKALEFIEARYLFNASNDQIQVVIHPQSVVHSMVSYCDGAVLAQLGQPDMKTPIARALAFPERINAGVEPLDFTKLSALTFDKPDPNRYPCLYLGMCASTSGQAATTTLNAANEVAVDAFLNNKISYKQISQSVEYALDKCCVKNAYELEEILEIDKQARQITKQFIESKL